MGSLREPIEQDMMNDHELDEVKLGTLDHAMVFDVVSDRIGQEVPSRERQTRILTNH